MSSLNENNTFNEITQIGRHLLAHVLAKAVTEIYDDVKLAIGPAIDNGFYYDFDIPTPISDSSFEKIEKKCPK